MPVQKGFERTPKTGGSQFGFSSATDLVARWTLFPERRDAITLEKGGNLPPFVTIHIPMRHTHRTIFHE
jgi:hypothetical protein